MLHINFNGPSIVLMGSDSMIIALTKELWIIFNVSLYAVGPNTNQMVELSV